jgi:hypothetical protein
MIRVNIVPNDKGNPPGKLADAELHFDDGLLAGLKLIGFGVWETRTSARRNVTFPARQYFINVERRSFALLRPTSDAGSQESVRTAILDAYARYEAGQSTDTPAAAANSVTTVDADSNLTLTRIALQCVMHERPDATERQREPDGPARYTYRLYRADSPCGGILIVTFRHPGQRPSSTAHYFEDYRSMPSLQPFERIACGRLTIARTAAVEREAS